MGGIIRLSSHWPHCDRTVSRALKRGKGELSSNIFGASIVLVSLSQMGTSLTYLTPVCLVWRAFGGLNLDQWVLGNGQESI